jgi:NAD(P)-dependent dehydrogenase (short-subunit alcohol dehydrogenase family)
MQGLQGKTVIVTGAAGGIGSAVVRRLAREGSRVASLDLVQPDVDGQAVGVTVDLTDEDSVAAAIAAARDVIGPIDALVAVAGISHTAPTHELSLVDFRRVLDVGIVGTFLAVRAVLPDMLDKGAGQIVTFGSTAAVRAAPGMVAYATAKGGVLQFTKSIAVEYAGRGIRANCLCPGGTLTPLMASVDADRIGPDHFKDRHPIGRYADPDEIAAAAAYLVSDDSSFVLGATFMADGGYTAS